MLWFPFLQNQLIFDNLIDAQRIYNFPIEIDVRIAFEHFRLFVFC